MKVQQFDGSAERLILTSMTISQGVVGAVSAKWRKEGLFDSKWSNTMASWCIEHYRKYNKPPGRALEGYFRRWAERGRDEETIKSMEQFLSGLSREYERNGHGPADEYVIDQAAIHFKKVTLRRLAEDITAYLDRGEVDKAEELRNNYNNIQIGAKSGISVLEDEEAVDAAFAEEKKQMLVQFPGAAGNFYKRAFTEDSFVAYMGKEKVGKSYVLADVGWRGIHQKRNVAIFETGDMSQSQILQRLCVRAARRPLFGDPNNPVKIPKSIQSSSGFPEVTYEEKLFPEGLTGDQAKQAFKELQTKIGEGRLRLSCHPNSSISVLGIETILNDWWRDDNWLPHIIIIDYADILAPMDGKADTRDQINATWKGLRRLNQQLHNSLVTATQSDADSYEKDTLGRSNFSEDKRKFAHVTGMCGINQNDTEKEKNLYRFNWVLRRELEFSERKCLWTAACLALANPVCCSTF